MGILADLPVSILLLAFMVTLCAGFVKGAVGFAMPLIMISGMSLILPIQTALAALILPTVFSNLFQALRHGVPAARQTVERYRVYLAILVCWLFLSAQLVTRISPSALFLCIGIPISLFCILQLRGWNPTLKPEHRLRNEITIGSIAGFAGGLSGTWGPPTVAYLTAINTPKAEQMRVQGVIYGVGAIMLALAHMKSGVFNWHTAPLSAAMLVPSMLGVIVGGRFHDQLPQAQFKKLTLFILFLAGLNLIRKGLMG